VFSPDGTKLLFESDASNLVAGDTNGRSDIFLKDLVTGEVTRISTAHGEDRLGDDPQVTADGPGVDVGDVEFEPFVPTDRVAARDLGQAGEAGTDLVASRLSRGPPIITSPIASLRSGAVRAARRRLCHH
jgi:hypothetical protein